MYTSVDFSRQIAAWRGFFVPQTRGSHTPIGVWLGHDLKNRLLLLLKETSQKETGKKTRRQSIKMQAFTIKISKNLKGVISLCRTS
jgi:hypothetical protein